MNRVYDPHKSSVMDTDANIVALSVYLIPLLGHFMSLGLISWVFPIVLLFIEKKSPLVYFHAVQSLTMQVVVAAFSVISMIVAFLSTGSNLLFGLNVFGAIGAVGLIGLMVSAVSIIVLALEIVGVIKAYGWEAYYLPVFGAVTRKFTKE